MYRRVALALLPLAIGVVCGQGGAPKPQLGTREPGAPSLDGFLVEGQPCIPVKRFAFESGFEMSVSPSGRHVAVKIGSRMSIVYGGETLQVDGQESAIAPKGIARNNDYYVPLYVLEKIYPVRFTYDKARRLLSAQLPERTLKMKILPKPPPERPKTAPK